MINKKIKNFFIPIIKRHRKYIYLLLTDAIIVGISSVVMPVLLKLETDQLVEKKSLTIFSTDFSPFSLFLVILGVILIVKVLDNLITSIIQVFKSSMLEYIENDIQLELFKNMENMEVGRTTNSRFKHLGTILHIEFRHLAQQVLAFPSAILRNCIQIIGLSAIYIYFDFRLLLIVIISAFISYFISIYSRNLSKKYEIKRQFTLGSKTWQYSNMFLRNFIDLATNGAISSSLKTYNGLLKEQINNGFKKNWTESIYGVANVLNFSISDILVKSFVGYSIFYYGKSIGMVALVVSSMNTFKDIINNLLNSKKNYEEFKFRQDSILIYLNICEPIGKIINKDQIINNVNIKNVNFAYPKLSNYEIEYLEILKKFFSFKNNTGEWLTENMEKLIENIEEDKKVENNLILKNISINFEIGKIYGIVGKNGAGKTTLMHLLSGFFRSYDGEIKFNENNTKKRNQKSFSNKVSFLTQIPFNLGRSTSVRENILLGCDDNVNDKEIWHYLEIFGLKEKIKKTKNGLDALIGDDIEFSGGENQIIAFIRLLLQDRNIIIMDEGTNQLDAENELLVMSELLKHKDKKIIIFITHRMSTISKADVIYCIENGTISHYGKHKELLKENNNVYARFYKTQVLHDNM